MKHLIAFGVPAASLVAGVRDTNSEGARALSKLGIQFRQADYNDKTSLEMAYAGIDTVVFVPISSVEHIERAITANNSVKAAVKTGVKRFVLVSVPPGRSDSVVSLQPGYIYAESLVRTSLLKSWVIVRMGIWTDNFIPMFKQALQSGVLGLPAKSSDRLPLISREDTARGIAAIAAIKDAIGLVYDLQNSHAVTLQDIADYLSEIANKKIVFKTITMEESIPKITAILPAAMQSLAPEFARIYPSFWHAGSLGEFIPTRDYHQIIGKDPETAHDFLMRNLQPQSS